MAEEHDGDIVKPLQLTLFFLLTYRTLTERHPCGWRSFLFSILRKHVSLIISLAEAVLRSVHGLKTMGDAMGRRGDVAGKRGGEALGGAEMAWRE